MKRNWDALEWQHFSIMGCGSKKNEKEGNSSKKRISALVFVECNKKN